MSDVSLELLTSKLSTSQHLRLDRSEHYDSDANRFGGS